MLHLSLTVRLCFHFVFLFFFNDTATTEIYTLSLHDALPIFHRSFRVHAATDVHSLTHAHAPCLCVPRSEEHTSELQSRLHLVCRLLLEKKKKKATQSIYSQFVT